MKKGILNFEFKAWWTIAHHKICQTIGDDVLSLFLSVMIAYFTLRYTFDVEIVEISGIDDLIEAHHTFDIGLILDAADPLARPIRQPVDVMAGLFLEDAQMDVGAATEDIETCARMRLYP
ncbi:hypothetical protein FXO38_27828 [Capsicum annuum]|nr:hypothetical protein FXO38_27828 [Capsicum annuum]